MEALLSSVYTGVSVLGVLVIAIFWLAGLEYRQRATRESQRLIDAEIKVMKTELQVLRDIAMRTDKSLAVIIEELHHTREVFQISERSRHEKFENLFSRVREIEIGRQGK